MNVEIKVIPHDQQVYPSVGMWRYIGDKLLIEVSDMKDWRYHALVATHELVESLTCRHQGVSQKSVDDFDKRYEKNRKSGDFSEPGDSKKAPYSSAHCVATGVERVLAFALGVCWSDYEQKINSL